MKLNTRELYIYLFPRIYFMSSEDTYYDMFSSILPKSGDIHDTEKAKENAVLYSIPTYAEFYKNNIALEKYKLGHLKVVAKHYKLRVSGKKHEIAGRIVDLFTKTRNSIQIQRIFRGHIVRYSVRLRGPGFLHREKCVNDTDFYTLDPLREISPDHFFSFEDAKGFIYGFDVDSLINLSHSSELINPYNREKFDKRTFRHLYSMVFINQLLFGRNRFPKLPKYLELEQQHRQPGRRTILPNARLQNAERLLEQTRNNTIEQRAHAVFAEIDALGNYTDANWFLSMTKHECARFYHKYYNWWWIVSDLSPETRSHICVFTNPFLRINLLHRYAETSHAEFQTACLELIETMVHTGIDTEHRKLGALHVLMILTCVSRPARQTMPWLFETMVGTL